MIAKISDVQEKALKIDLDWVKDFNKNNSEYKAYVETPSWAEYGYAPVTVMIYQETEDPNFRIIVAYISSYYNGYCSTWYQDKRCPADWSQTIQRLEKQLIDLYDPTWFGRYHKK